MIVTPEFSFTQYDTVAFARPDNQQTIPLYGIDLELGNALTKKGFKVIGEKELSSAPDAVKQKTLLVQMHLSTTTRRSIVSATFSSAATGKSELSVMDIIKGDLSDGSDLSDVTRTLFRAIERTMNADARQSISQKQTENKASTQTDKAATDPLAAAAAVVPTVTPTVTATPASANEKPTETPAAQQNEKPAEKPAAQ